MISTEQRQVLRDKLALYEGCIEHMYLDSNGYVTVAIGQLLANQDAALKLPFLRQDGSAAASSEILADYEAVRAQPAGKRASYYGTFTQLHLTQAAMDALVDGHIDSFGAELLRLYPDFDQYPSQVQLGLFDMIFNLGMHKLQSGFPSFNRAVKARDWQEAARQCHRRGIGESRNNYVRGLFEEAAAMAPV
ncbi:hypothetical protein [Gallaecimonas sp. GXIMD4217]|uniref:hypothetical protein n=1 Tax=Gallaecimonas sp. GXIMD4217 TaxID=3131927 RepID=UPI00311B3525